MIPQHIEITQHAMKRLKQRVKTHGTYRSWQLLVRTARYRGQNYLSMTQEQYDYVRKHFKKNNFTSSTEIRFLDGFFYVFAGNHGHARTLITVIKYEEN